MGYHRSPNSEKGRAVYGTEKRRDAVEGGDSYHKTWPPQKQSPSTFFSGYDHFLAASRYNQRKFSIHWNSVTEWNGSQWDWEKAIYCLCHRLPGNITLIYFEHSYSTLSISDNPPLRCCWAPLVPYNHLKCMWTGFSFIKTWRTILVKTGYALALTRWIYKYLPACICFSSVHFDVWSIILSQLLSKLTPFVNE